MGLVRGCSLSGVNCVITECAVVKDAKLVTGVGHAYFSWQRPRKRVHKDASLYVKLPGVMKTGICVILITLLNGKLC